VNVRRIVSWLLALGCWVVPLHAATEGFSETVSTVVVEVPVQVVRDGQPVRGLTQDDFAVYDGRHRQKITGFEVIDLGSPAAVASPVPAAAPELSTAARRHFLLLFDLAFSDPKSLVKAREAAEGIVGKLHPSDLVGVATYSNMRGPELILGFTPDRAQVRSALATLEKPEMFGRNRDLLRLVMEEGGGRGPSASSGGGRTGVRESAGAAIGEAATDLLQTLVDQSNRAERHSQQNVIQGMARAMSDFAKFLGGVEGRKYVIYLSEGFDSGLLQGTNDQGRRDEMNAATQSGEYWKASSEELFGDTGSLNGFERMLEELRRGDCVVESVDIAGLRAAEDMGNRRSGGRDVLLNFAKSTGGELYENFNDLGVALGQMLDRTSVTYVLVFQPDKIEPDGSYHRLRVELVGQPRDVRAVFRPGYYAPRPFTEQTQFEKLLDAQTQVVAGRDAGTLDVAVLTAPFAMANQAAAYVPLLVEVGGPSLLAGDKQANLPAEVYAYAFDSKGAIVDFVNQRLGFEVAKVRPALLASGFKFFGHLELPPGDYTVRVLVRNGNTGDTGLRVASLHVPAFAASEAALLPPFVPEAPGRWLIVREQPRGELKNAPYPFLIAGTPYIPASRPVIAGGEETQLALVGYSLGDGKLEATARVLSAAGKEMGPATIQVLKREAGTKPARLVANVTPPRLSPGEYRLEVKVGTHTSSTPFVVGGT
jgi:VWFA-related protein